MRNRKTGWLTDDFYHQFREVLLHALGRYGAVCPAYCLVRDHLHLLLLGWTESCQQRVLIRFLKKHTNSFLRESGFEWQKQPYDNVLREKDRERAAFQKIVGYVLNNPVRAHYVERWEDWCFLDSIIPGYPEVKLRNPDFWERFWRIYHIQKYEDSTLWGARLPRPRSRLREKVGLKEPRCSCRQVD